MGPKQVVSWGRGSKRSPIVPCARYTFPCSGRPGARHAVPRSRRWHSRAAIAASVGGTAVLRGLGPHSRHAASPVTDCSSLQRFQGRSYKPPSGRTTSLQSSADCDSRPFPTATSTSVALSSVAMSAIVALPLVDIAVVK